MPFAKPLPPWNTCSGQDISLILTELRFTTDIKRVRNYPDHLNQDEFQTFSSSSLTS